MEQFLVPQFLDVEPKVIGPITVRQFIIMMVAVLIMVIEYKLADFGLFIILGLLTLFTFATVAFVRINGRAFHYFLLSVVQTMRTPRLRVWNKEVSEGELRAILKRKNKEEVVETKEAYVKKPLEKTRLSELSLIVNTGGVYKGEDVPLASLEKTYGKQSLNESSLKLH